MKLSKLEPYQALALKPSVDLDIFVFEFIFDGIVEKTAFGSQVPSFSRKAEAAKMLMIKMFAGEDCKTLQTRWGQEYYVEARESGQIKTDSMVPVWRLEADSKYIAYGRTNEEAICKLAIILKVYENT